MSLLDVLGELFAVCFKAFVVGEGLVILEVVGDDRVDIVREEFSDLIFFGVDFIFDILDALVS